MSEYRSPDFPEYNGKTREVWDALAEWWDDKIGGGNDFQDLLIEPATERLLALQPGKRVLDIACGAGRFARRMSALGAEVTAFDHSRKFIERARQWSAGSMDKIRYMVLDVTDPVALRSLGVGQYDAAVCTMALMDMASIEPLISTLPELLKPRGRFVFSVLHPVFNSGTSRLVAERYEKDGELMTNFGLTVTDYAEPFHFKGIGIIGQPVPQDYFHRSISLLFNTCFRHGFMLDGMEEPTLPRKSDPASRLSLMWSNLNSIPPVLVARMRSVK
jgi:2-polyprenyl-3-methyl-5-hydroxy-6-metoxy-1,4-benzoquinol methylase